jgi:23S rRNA pseudouridine2605 synthase
MKRGRRLAAYLADAGVASRRRAEDLVRRGEVTVNGITVLDPASPVEAGKDRVAVDGSPVRPLRRRTYLLLNKPPGCLSACREQGGKPTVTSLVPQEGKRLYPVGRLDFNAEGLMLLTDDGELAFRLTHPRFQVPRTYLAKVKGEPDAAALGSLTRGITDQGEKLRATAVEIARRGTSNVWCRIVLTEGKNREVRRLFDAIGHPVLRLIRTSFGPLDLGRLLPGEHRSLRPAEVAALKAATGGKEPGPRRRP